jgi:MFS family permease
MLTGSFAAASFMDASSPAILMNAMFALAGIGWATINVNSFPMAVEMCSGSDLGKYTGYYYTASMAAQIVAPILSGILYDLVGMRAVFFAFGTVFVALSFVTMFFVRHGDSAPEMRGLLESLDTEED